MVVAHRIGRRDEPSLREMLEWALECLRDPLSVLYTSDEWDAYGKALKNLFGVEYVPQRKPGPGRPPNPKVYLPGELKYAVVHKRRERGRVVEVERKVVYGDPKEIERILKKSLVSSFLNTSFIERNNLTLRQNNRRLQRKTLGFSKKLWLLDCQIRLFLGYYHFVRPHGGLTIEREGEKNIQRTPFMAAGFTDRIWSLEELMRYVPGAS